MNKDNRIIHGKKLYRSNFALFLLEQSVWVTVDFVVARTADLSTVGRKIQPPAGFYYFMSSPAHKCTNLQYNTPQSLCVSVPCALKSNTSCSDCLQNVAVSQTLQQSLVLWLSCDYTKDKTLSTVFVAVFFVVVTVFVVRTNQTMPRLPSGKDPAPQECLSPERRPVGGVLGWDRPQITIKSGSNIFCF